MGTWNPDVYHRYREYRQRPFRALLRGLSEMRGNASEGGVSAIGPAVDLGCGTGELTALLHETLGADDLVGVDSSLDMLEKARLIERPGLRFVASEIRAYLATIADDHFGTVFSNAALHWLPDQLSLFAELARVLRPGGVLAVQVPYNDDHISHRTIVEVAREAPFRAELDGWARETPIMEPRAYAELLDELGFTQQRVEMRVFPQHLESREDVVSWVRGSTLTPYASRLSSESYAAMLERYRTLLMTRLADSRPFFYPYSRMFMWATR